MLVNNKFLIYKFVCNISKQYNIPVPKISYKPLIYEDAYADFKNNRIVINTNLVKRTEEYLLLTKRETSNIIESVLIHELTHIKQYHCNNVSQKIGTDNEIIIKNTDYNYNILSLYIKSSFNPFLQKVYILQPNEYEAFQNSIKSLIKNNSTSLSRINIVSNAENFIKEKFQIDNPVKEIENALLNLHDNGNRECSPLIQDLVIRCAICSYVDKEDYGVDKISILLGENYEKWLNEQLKEKCDVDLKVYD